MSVRLVETEIRGNAVWIWLNRPARHNALIPELISDLRHSIADAAKVEPTALVLSGRGHSFSTGGDIGGFLDHSETVDALIRYSDGLVEGLHQAILDLLKFPAPVINMLNGPVTGGSTGLVLASDLVTMAEGTFLQPYYSAVGFGPDGGWTALLPERLGTSKSLEVQFLNTRIVASEARDLGLVTCVCPKSDLEAKVQAWVLKLEEGMAQTHQATRRGIWDKTRCAQVKARLDLEKSRFLELIARPETLQGMQRFTQISA